MVFKRIKVGIKSRIRTGLEARRERIEFEKKVRKKTTKIRRQAFAEEAERQAELKGKMIARQRANRKTLSSRIGIAIGKRVQSSQAKRKPLKPLKVSIRDII